MKERFCRSDLALALATDTQVGVHWVSMKVYPRDRGWIGARCLLGCSVLLWKWRGLGAWLVAVENFN